MKEKTFLGCFDYRNAKYQGNIVDNSFEGLGILMDNQFMLAIAHFQHQEPQGPALLVYPNRQYFQGTLRGGLPEGVCLYRMTSEAAYLALFQKGIVQRLALIEKNQVSQLQSRQGKTKLVSSHSVKNDEEGRKIAQQIVKQKVSKEIWSAVSYVKVNMGPDIQCSQQAGMQWIGFANTPSLGLKISKGTVRQIGHYDLFPRNIQFGRQAQGGPALVTTVIQQGDFRNNQTVAYTQGNRSIQAIRLVQQYFKRGTSFRDKFISFKKFQDVSQIFGDIKKLCRKEVMGAFGQSILENSPHAQLPHSRRQQPRVVEPGVAKFVQISNTDNLKKIQQELMAAVNRKHNKTTYSPSRYSPHKISTDSSQPLASATYRLPSSPSRPRSKQTYKYLKDLEQPQIQIKIKRQQNAHKNYSPEQPQKYFPGARPIREITPNRQEATTRPRGKIFNYLLQKLQSPINQIKQKKISRSPAVLSRELTQEIPSNSYTNYMNYKNRKKQSVTPQKSAKKYEIYEKKTTEAVLAQQEINVSPGGYVRTFHNRKSYRYL